MATETVPAVPGATTTTATVPMSATLADLIERFKKYPADFVKLPDGIVPANVLSLFGDGTTAQVVKFDFTTATDVSSRANTERNRGKLVGAAVVDASIGENKFRCRLTLNDIMTVVNSGKPEALCIVRYSEVGDNTYSNIVVQSAA